MCECVVPDVASLVSGTVLSGVAEASVGSSFSLSFPFFLDLLDCCWPMGRADGAEEGEPEGD